MAGIAAEVLPKIVLSWDIFMAVPVRAMPEVWAKPATANINLALAHHLTLGAGAPALAQVTILTPALAQATLVAPALPAVENIPPAPALSATNGRTALVKY